MEQGRQYYYGRIWKGSPLRKRVALHMSPKMLASCMPMDTLVTPLSCSLRLRCWRNVEQFSGTGNSLSSRLRSFLFGYPVTVNNLDRAQFARRVAGGIVGEANVASVCMSVGAEDMTYFLEAMPGCYLRLGSGNLDTGLIHLHHNHKCPVQF